jgi:primosomal protein N'
MEATLMKQVGLIGAAVVLLSLGSITPLYAAQEDQAKHQDDAKAPKQEQAKPEKQPEKQTEPAKQEEKQQQEQAKTNTRDQQEQAKSSERQAKGEQEQQAKQQQQQAKTSTRNQEEQAKSAKQQQNQQAQAQRGQQHAQRTAAEEQRQRSMPALRLSARGEGRIPDDRFRANFGREHVFRIGSPQMVGGYSRFQYGGFWFGFVDPWPVGWYYTDDVYVDYVDGGYYLYNPYYPDTRVSINVVL